MPCFWKKARVPSRMNAKKYMAVDIYFLWSNQNAQKVLSTCLANAKYFDQYFVTKYTNHPVAKR